jgi:hypothetical protein
VSHGWARLEAAPGLPARRSLFARYAASMPCALLLAACGADEGSFAPTGVSATPNANIANVANVSWTTSEASIGYVSYGKTPSLGENTPMETVPGTSHAQALLGLSADTKYYYRVVTWDGHAAGASPVQSLRTPRLPNEVPSFTVRDETEEEEPFDQLLLVPVADESTVVTVLNASGEVIWYHVEDSERAVTRARFSNDGRSVVYNAIDGADGADSDLVVVALDGSNVDSIPVPGLGRDFVELENGDFAALALDERDHDGEPLRGDQIVEVKANGTVTPVWSTWDCFDPAAFPGDGPDGEWTGAASLTLDADDGYVVSLRHLSSVLRADPASGDCTWVFGAAAPTLDFADDSPAFVHPGAIYAAGERVIVLDADGAGGSTSRVLDYTLDLDAATATAARTYTPSPALHVDDLGSVTLMTRDRLFVNWSTTGKLEVVTEEDDVAWSLSGTGVTFGYEELVSDNDGLYLATEDGS